MTIFKGDLNRREGDCTSCPDFRTCQTRMAYFMTVCLRGAGNTKSMREIIAQDLAEFHIEPMLAAYSNRLIDNAEAKKLFDLAHVQEEHISAN